MPTGAVAKRLMLGAALGLVALLIVGFVIGAIGSKMFGLGDGYLSKPEIHLPPQPVFPSSTRDYHLGLAEPADHETKPEAAAEGEDGVAEKKGEEAHHSKPLGFTKFAVTNTLLSSWIATIVIIVFFVAGSGKKRLIPGRFQALVEMLFEAALNFCENVVGRDMGRKVFPVVATIFFFVLFNAWLALFPFYQFLGFVTDGEIKAHLLRSAGTDLNMPLALALVSFVFVEYWGFRAHGFGYLKKFFALGNVIRLRAIGVDRCLRGVPGACQRVCPGGQLHLPAVRQHDRRGDPGSDDHILGALRRYAVRFRVGALGRTDSGHHIRRAHAGVFVGGRQTGGALGWVSKPAQKLYRTGGLELRAHG